MKEFFDSVVEIDDIYKACEKKDHAVLEINGTDGLGVVTIYKVFLGVYIIVYNMELGRINVDLKIKKNLFSIDYCKEGGFKCNYTSPKKYDLRDGNVRFSTKKSFSNDIHLPSGRYMGLSIVFQEDEASIGLKDAVSKFSINLDLLKQKYMFEGLNLILDKEKYIEGYFSNFYNLTIKGGVDFFKIKVLEMLWFLQNYEMPSKKDYKYISKAIVKKTEEIKDYITSNLSENITIKQISEMFKISETALKESFKYLYGEPIMSYIRRYKMQVAADTLRNEAGVKIIDLAGDLGYDSPSKFSAAFKKIFGVTPKEYREDPSIWEI